MIILIVFICFLSLVLIAVIGYGIYYYFTQSDTLIKDTSDTSDDTAAGTTLASTLETTLESTLAYISPTPPPPTHPPPTPPPIMCRAGTYLNGNTCISCPTGTYSSSDTRSCNRCTNNQTSVDGISCSQCPPNYYSSWGDSVAQLTTNGICKYCVPTDGKTFPGTIVKETANGIVKNTPFYIYPCDLYIYINNPTRRVLTMQSDGNLAAYALSNNGLWVQTWSTNTSGNPGAYAVIGEGKDNCIQIKNDRGETIRNYGSNESNTHPVQFRMQADGNMGLYNSSGGVVWNARI